MTAKEVLDLYFKTYHRTAGNFYTEQEINDFVYTFGLLLDQNMDSDANKLFTNFCISLAIPKEEFLKFLASNTNYFYTFFGFQNLADLQEHNIEFYVSSGLQAIASGLTDIVSGGLMAMIRGLIKPALIIGGGYLLFKHLNK
jgi:hypothetical protein